MVDNAVRSPPRLVRNRANHCDRTDRVRTAARARRQGLRPYGLRDVMWVILHGRFFA
jgi:hypothetical protein